MKTLNRSHSNRGAMTTESAIPGESLALRLARNVVFRPRAGMCKAPDVSRLWELPSLKEVLYFKGLTSSSETVAVLVRNEGHRFLAFYDLVNSRALGLFYAGSSSSDPAHKINPSLTAGGAEAVVCWENLAPGLEWHGAVIGNRLVLGNGCDDNLVFSLASGELRRMGDGARPLAPVVTASAPVTMTRAGSRLVVGQILFEGLEPDFLPENEGTYKRGDSNYVKVTVAQGPLPYFTSQLRGKGTLAQPWHYILVVPLQIPTQSEVVAFVERDANAAGIIKARMLSAQDGPVDLFHDAPLSGGATEFQPGDVFQSPQVDVVLTYFKRDGDMGRESAPCRVVTCAGTSGGRVNVSVQTDPRLFGDLEYDTIRIYLAEYVVSKSDDTWAFDGDVAYFKKGEIQATGGFGAGGYASFKLALEVPYATATHVLAPSLLSDKRLDIAIRTPPPATIFAYAFRRVWFSGNKRDPMAVWFGRVQANDEDLPETIKPEDYILFTAGTAQDRVAALREYRGRLAVLTSNRIHAAGADFYEAGWTTGAMPVGPLGPEALITWLDGDQLFLGQDYNIHAYGLPSDSNPNSTLPVARPFMSEARDYISRHVAPQTRLVRGLVDFGRQVWWLWLPAPSEARKGFLVDLQHKTLSGPFDSPQFVAADRLNDSDGRIIGIDPTGNLWVMAPIEDMPEEPFFEPGGAVEFLADTGDPGESESQLDGRLAVNVAGVGTALDALVLEIATLPVNGGERAIRKACYGVLWQSLHNSSGFCIVEVMNERGQRRRVVYGEMYGKSQHYARMLLQGEAFTVTLKVVTQKGKPCLLRDGPHLELVALREAKRN